MVEHLHRDCGKAPRRNDGGCSRTGRRRLQYRRLQSSAPAGHLEWRLGTKLRGSQTAVARRSIRLPRSSFEFLGVDRRRLGLGRGLEPKLTAAAHVKEMMALSCTYAVVVSAHTKYTSGPKFARLCPMTRQIVGPDRGERARKMERQKERRREDWSRNDRGGVGCEVTRRCRKSIVGSNERRGARGGFVRATKDVVVVGTVRHSTRKFKND